jgi:hypothetical protein
MASRKKHHIRFRTLTCFLSAFGAFLIGVSTASSQSVSGTVVNDSQWLNNTNNSPPHWYVPPDTGSVSNGAGFLMVAVYSLLPDGTLGLSQARDYLDPPESDDPPVALWGLPASTNYVLGTSLDAGNYRVVAWIDGNDNGSADTGEPFGYEDVAVSEDSDVTDVRVTIVDDSDGDDMEDWWEVHWFGDLAQTWAMDYDNDGLSNGEEYDLIHTSAVSVDPNNWDTDGDGLDDAWERFYGFDPTDPTGDNGASGDPDGDALFNIDEYLGPDGIGWRKDDNVDGTTERIAAFTPSRDAMNPTSDDSDQDGATDTAEFLTDLTHPVHSMSSTNFYPRSMAMSADTNGVVVTDPSGSMYAFGTQGGTVEFWIRPGADGDGVVYGFPQATVSDSHFRIVLDDYRPRMDLLNGTTVMASVGGVGPSGSVQQLEANKWTHIACVIAPINNSLNMYVDGVLLIAQETFIKPTFVLGRPTICQDFTDGHLDELRVWDYPRSAADVEHWSGRIYPAPGYVQQWATTASGRVAQMYTYSNPHPLLGYFRFDDGGTNVENFAFINYGLYPNREAYYLPVTNAMTTTDQAAPISGSDDADGDGLPEWWVELHNIEKYLEYYSSAHGPTAVMCPDDDGLLEGFEYFRAFTGYGSVGTGKSWVEVGGTTFYDPKTRPDFYDGDRSSYTRYVYLFAQPMECPLNVYTPGMISTIITVNGTRVTLTDDEDNTAQSFDVAQYMKVGRNQIHVECQSLVEYSDYEPISGAIDLAPYSVDDYRAYNPSLPAALIGCDDKAYKLPVAVGKFDADLACNGVPMVVRGDESRADPRAVWHCQVWSEFYERSTVAPRPDQEGRALPGNSDYGVPLHAEQDNNPLDPEAADDKLDAVYEYICKSNPRDRDSNNNGVGDGDEDFDSDGLVNSEEQRFGSDPWLPDSDDDGLIDGLDVGADGHPAQSLSPQKNLSVRFGGGPTDFLDFPKEQRFALAKWTIEAWVKPDADETDGGIVMQRLVSDTAVNYEVGLTAANTPYVRYVSIGGAEVRADSAVPVPADGATWTHLAASYYDRSLTLYVGGTNVASTTGGAFPALHAGGPVQQRIGRGFKGCFDEVRLWEEERSAAEIVEKREEVLTGLEATLVSYYRFDDSTSYTNLPPLVGSSANNGVAGTIAAVPWAWGQVEDNVLRYAADWQNQWEHAASFNGASSFSSDSKVVGPPRLQVFIESDDARDAGAQWTHNGGAIWNDSGYLETRLAAGAYEINFRTVEGWISPDAFSVNLVRGISTVVTGVYMQTASLTVILDNNTDVKSNATWTIDGGLTDNGTGIRIDGLQPGVPGYDILFADISADAPGWETPSAIHVELLESEERTVTASYMPVIGSLQIVFTPDNAPSAGRWRVSGNSNWFGSGETATNLSYGEHTVEYNEVQWWDEPANETIVIAESALLMLEREWTKLPEPSTITAVLEPGGVVTAGAQWQVGGNSYNSGEVVIVSAGTYTVGFDAVDGFLAPSDVSVSTDGASVVVTGRYHRVEFMETSGTGLGDLNMPRGIDVAGRYVYVADTDNDRILRYDQVTELWTLLGGPGQGVGQFDQPFGVAVAPNGDVWVADTGNHRVQRLSKTGNEWSLFGGFGRSVGQFNGPYGIAVDSSDYVFVADYHNSRVQKRAPNGVWSVAIASGASDGYVRFPSGLGTRSDGLLYVSDYNPSAAAGQPSVRIQSFGLDGAFVSVIGSSDASLGSLGRPRGICTTPELDILVADSTLSRVKALPASGTWADRVGAGVLSMPHDVDSDLWGNVFIADSGNDRILMLPIEDTDLDRIPDAAEAGYGTSPTVADTDFDGFSDGVEILGGSDPLDWFSVPYVQVSGMPPVEAIISEAQDFDGDGVADVATYDGVAAVFHVIGANARYIDQGWGMTGDVAVPGDYTGNGTANYAVFRPSDGRWYIRPDGGGSPIIHAFGSATDILVPGDYDGDGRTDLAVIQRNTFTWRIRRSSDGLMTEIQFGGDGDIPVPGDYNQDGMLEPAVFRPELATWFHHTATGRAAVAWGSAGDIPCPGDYDGDGFTDRAVFAPGTATWSVRPSGGGADTATAWGSTGDRPVPGDYDGDGRTDIALYRAGSREWRIRKSSDGTMLSLPPVFFGWGAALDCPVPADFESGTGSANVAVYRASSGTWYIRNLTSGVTQEPMGTAGDIPVAGDYDGDGFVDVAVWRLSDYAWVAKLSGGGGTRVQQWGWAGDVTVPGDYDGDGLADFAIYRPSDGTTSAMWHIKKGDGSGRIDQPWGWIGDIPVSGDFDGDGKQDVAIYRPSDGVSSAIWYVKKSDGSGTLVQPWGWVGDQPIARDYDGDGKADFAVYRPSDGTSSATWYVKKSDGSGTIVQPWGWVGDQPVPADYDQDGTTDFAVYQNGVWTIRQSSDGAKMRGRGPILWGNVSESPVAIRSQP